ncbi:MAG: S-(hydroxymethyl)glutathione dehydrogenase/class III alcohol dehydrogenase [Legionellales bacterium]|nr:S-(hydroxymethyl)glutathione dehydrogenase/class III alcohol dehydrogenase [Legionellales bacterium]
MKSRAAVLYEPNQRLQIEEIDVSGPMAGEVLVKMHSASICHMDMLAKQGKLNHTRYPTILGHEGAGEVVEVGSDVKNLLVGDRVVPLYVPECGQCPSCMSAKTNLCTALDHTQMLGVMPDGTTRYHLNGQPIYHFMGTSCLSEYIVVPEIALARISHQVDMKSACLLGCTLTTGLGAVMNVARITPGSTVAVFGLGGIGLSVIQAAVMSQAARIIGIDTNINKFNLAQKFGASTCINPRDHSDSIETVIKNITDGGVDFAFECIGFSETMQSALACTRPGWGKAVLLGVADTNDRIDMQPGLLTSGRTFQGARFGGVKGRSQLPEFAEQCINGEIMMNDLITHALALEDVNLAFDLQHSGESIRSVITF